jgi:hypothetical protein
VICCLLALLAALPGLAVLRRMRSEPATPAHCVAACAGGARLGLGRNIGFAVAAAGTVVLIAGGALSIHKWSHGMYWQEVAPICSALDRISSVPVRSWRVTASNQ